MSKKEKRKPFFYDITLRDGNQALKHPWNTKQKEEVFKRLVKLGVQGVEVGFSGASDMDFEACQHLAGIAPKNIVISGLARAMERDIVKVADSLKAAAKPRIHTFIALSPFHMKYVLKKKPKDVQKYAIEAVKLARELLGKKGSIQFSAEHFGDCIDNLNFVIDTFEKCIEAGADVLNLPNTVERMRPKIFIDMVAEVVKQIGNRAIIAVHNHNDLGMATAVTVESFFAGATQLECSLNGLGERAGNTNLYEVAVALHNSGVKVPLNFKAIYETAIFISEISNIPIYEKSALIGTDALAHRSGIHQDGTVKTQKLKKGAYRPIEPSLIGRDTGEHLGFTSQSGKTAIYEILHKAKLPISMQESIYLQPYMKKLAEKKGELTLEEMKKIYFEKLFNVKGAFTLLSFKEIYKRSGQYKHKLELKYKNKKLSATGKGSGPIESCIDALNKLQFSIKLLHYEQIAINEKELGSKAEAMTIIKLKNLETGKEVISRGLCKDTRKANIEAIFNGLNLLF